MHQITGQVLGGGGKKTGILQSGCSQSHPPLSLSLLKKSHFFPFFLADVPYKEILDWARQTTNWAKSIILNIRNNLLDFFVCLNQFKIFLSVRLEVVFLQNKYFLLP